MCQFLVGDGPLVVVSNIQGLLSSLQDAAREKAAAGEGRNVEHVAEADDVTHKADTKKRKMTTFKQKPSRAGLPEASQATKRSRRLGRT